MVLTSRSPTRIHPHRPYDRRFIPPGRTHRPCNRRFSPAGRPHISIYTALFWWFRSPSRPHASTHTALLTLASDFWRLALYTSSATAAVSAATTTTYYYYHHITNSTNTAVIKSQKVTTTITSLSVTYRREVFAILNHFYTSCNINF